jgi:hypothetical protein
MTDHGRDGLIGDVFSSPEWVDCTCSQVKEKQLEDCSSVCLEYFQEGGGMLIAFLALYAGAQGRV